MAEAIKRNEGYWNQGTHSSMYLCISTRKNAPF